jgi:hypothetical protein
MMIKTRPYITALFFVVLAATAHAQPGQVRSSSPLEAPRVLTNQVGYESDKPKRAVVLTTHHLSLTSFDLVDETTGKSVYHGKPIYSGPVDKWKHWQFWTINFTPYTAAGTYRLRVNGPEGPSASWPFIIGSNVLEKATLSDILYYFKGQRCAGLLDQADHHLPLPASAHNPDAAIAAPPVPDTLDLHGGWYDATGDYGKHLSHLSFSAYFNPQQIPLVVYSLLKTNELLAHRSGTDYRQFIRRILDEANFGADYLVRVQAKGGSFYRSIDAPGAGKLAKDRAISPEQQSYRIKQSKGPVHRRPPGRGQLAELPVELPIGWGNGYRRPCHGIDDGRSRRFLQCPVPAGGRRCLCVPRQEQRRHDE